MSAENPREKIESPIVEALYKWGKNSNSFFALYKGFQHFSTPDRPGEFIVYVDTKEGWVMAGEPIGPHQSWPELMKKFLISAEKAGKVVVGFPVGESFSEKVREMAFGRVMIGSEPIFRLEQLSERGEQMYAAFPLALRRHAQGAVVKEYDSVTMTSQRSAEFFTIIEKWLVSRKMAPLGFINSVQPWACHEHKRYFCVEMAGKIHAFIAAMPVPARNAWYFVDVMRDPDSPNGLTELLILESMQILKREGVKEVSLGVAPLAHLEHSPRREHPILYKILKLSYKYSGWFYGFQSLFEFKAKLRPHRWEPVYLLYSNKRLGIRHLASILEAYYPRKKAGEESVGKLPGRRKPSRNTAKISEKVLAQDVLSSPIPSQIPEMLNRVRLAALYSILFSYLGVVGHLKTDFASTFFTFVVLSSMSLLAGELYMVGSLLLAVLVSFLAPAEAQSHFLTVSVGMGALLVMLRHRKRTLTVASILAATLLSPIAGLGVLLGALAGWLRLVF